MTKITKQQLVEDMDDGLSTSEIAERHGMSERSIRWRKQQLAKQGYSPEHDMLHPAPEGFYAKGTSTLYDPEGNIKLQWVKTNIDLEKQALLIEEAIRSMAEEIEPEKPVDYRPHLVSHELLVQFTLTDFHLGMLSWAEETGADWDMKIAEDTLVAWFTAAIESAPHAGTAILAQLGDFLHWDGLDAVTPSSGHVLDADTRFQKLTRVAIRSLRRIIRMLLEKFPQVHVICAEGNHDMASSIWLRELLTALYEDEPRITIDRNPDPYYCYEFGKVSLFYHHGHKRNAAQLENVLIAKFREVYGRTQFSYAHVGHLHHMKMLESSTMVVEQHRTLAAKDAYASRGGWLSQRSAAVITYHAEYGEVARITITPEMLK